MIKRNNDEYMAVNPWIDPWNWVWEDTRKWDMANANWDEIDEHEPDIELIIQALDFSDSGNYSEAIPILCCLAEQGSARAMIELGEYYEFGYGVSINIDLAESWYRRASAGGSQYAMLECAHFAASRKDYSKCDVILQPGVDIGWASAAFWQAYYRYIQQDSKDTYRSILPLLRMADKCEHPGGQIYLTNFMVRGKFGLFRMPVGFLRAVRLAIIRLNKHRPIEASPT